MTLLGLGAGCQAFGHVDSGPRVFGRLSHEVWCEYSCRFLPLLLLLLLPLLLTLAPLLLMPLPQLKMWLLPTPLPLLPHKSFGASGPFCV